MRAIHSFRRAALTGAAFVFTLGLAMPSCAAQSQTPRQPKPLPAPPLNLTLLAGQPVPVLPITYLIPEVKLVGLPVGQAALLAWADSIVGEVLQMRGPEVTWILPPELRRRARRNSMVTDPDHMGQALLRSDAIKQLRDPLYGYLRSLAAVTNSRVVMIPAAVKFSGVSDGVKAEITMVAVDVRGGRIAWRSHPVAVAATAGEALAAAVAVVLPDLH